MVVEEQQLLVDMLEDNMAVIADTTLTKTSIETEYRNDHLYVVSQTITEFIVKWHRSVNTAVATCKCDSGVMPAPILSPGEGYNLISATITQDNCFVWSYEETWQNVGDWVRDSFTTA